MAGATLAHNLITANVARALGNRLAERDGTVWSSDLRVAASGSSLYFYPDVTVSCGDDGFDGPTLTTPLLIVEVLSPATEQYDRSTKFAQLQRIASLLGFVLVAQDAARVEVFERDAGASVWRYRLLEGRKAEAPLDVLGLTLPLADLYHRVRLPGPPHGPVDPAA